MMNCPLELLKSRTCLEQHALAGSVDEERPSGCRPLPSMSVKTIGGRCPVDGSDLQSHSRADLDRVGVELIHVTWRGGRDPIL